MLVTLKCLVPLVSFIAVLGHKIWFLLISRIVIAHYVMKLREIAATSSSQTNA